jgi:type I site-specific restriction endonuclease
MSAIAVTCLTAKCLTRRCRFGARPTTYPSVDELKKAFARHGDVDDAAVAKITGSVDDPAKLIRRFRNDALPSVAVTVDLLTTGIDIPKIVNLVFIRRVNSRILYEQMLGRATRLCPDIGKEEAGPTANLSLRASR